MCGIGSLKPGKRTLERMLERETRKAFVERFAKDYSETQNPFTPLQRGVVGTEVVLETRVPKVARA